MPSDLVTQTVQGTILSITSNILAQIISAYKQSVGAYLLLVASMWKRLADQNTSTDTVHIPPRSTCQIRHIQYSQQPTEYRMADLPRRPLPDERPRHTTEI